MRALVLTLATDGYDAIWRFCLDSQRRYCERLGYEHRIVTKRVGGLNGKWSKLQLALEALREGRDVLVIDADVEITAVAPPFTPLIEAHGHDIAGVLGISGRINSGVMAFSGRDDSRAAAFLADCLAERETPVPREDFVTPEGENGHVINVLRRDAYAPHVHHIDPAWNCCVPQGATEAYLLHYTGYLRIHLYEGKGIARLTSPWSPADPQEKRMRGEFHKHYRLLKQAIEKLEADPGLFAALQRQVSSLARLEDPAAAGENVGAWLRQLAIAQGIYKLPTVEFLRRLVEPDDWIVDGGAYAGYFADVLLKAGARGDRLIAVEADPSNAAMLRRNLQGTGVQTVEAALDAGPGPRFLHRGPAPWASTLFPREADGPAIEVQTETLDGLAERIGIERIGLMKLDIEGAEIAAIQGGKALLSRSPDAILVVESDAGAFRRAGLSSPVLLRQLNTLGFVGRMILDDFSFGPAGVIFQQRPINVAFARPERWEEILGRLAGTSSAVEAALAPF